ncbi:hypothetical protein [Lysobacter gummosus]|uniref:hypothetical protein n=1 Tax=Lysobacter gummosus TaxID=262324 RepID=UPI0036288E91
MHRPAGRGCAGRGGGCIGCRRGGLRARERRHFNGRCCLGLRNGRRFRLWGRLRFGRCRFGCQFDHRRNGDHRRRGSE